MNSDNTNNWILEQTNLKEVFIKSKDNLKLHGYIIDNVNVTKTYVIVVHGYLEKAIQMSTFAKGFYNLGYNLLIPDLRAHGSSEGKYIGLGWEDRLDLIEWINYIVKLNSSSQIILFGISMGGAAVMMCSGENLPFNVKAIIEDCGFSSITDELSHHLYRTFKIPSFPLLDIINLTTKIRAKFWIKPASAKKQVAKCKIPILFIHGDDDDIVPHKMIDDVFLAANCPKEKLIVPNAGHGVSNLVAPYLYWNTIKKFLCTYIPD